MTPKDILLTMLQVVLGFLGEKGTLLRPRDSKLDEIFQGIKNAKSDDERDSLLKSLNDHMHPNP